MKRIPLSLVPHILACIAAIVVAIFNVHLAMIMVMIYGSVTGIQTIATIHKNNRSALK